MDKRYKIGIIGAGNMGYALLKGVLTSGLYMPDDIIVSDVSDACIKKAEALKVHTTGDNVSLAGSVNTLILAVKPQVIDTVLSHIKAAVSDKTLVISIAAGIPTKRIQAILGDNVRVIRVMPNTPMLVGKGMSVISGGKGVLPYHINTAVKIFESASKVMVLDEGMMDIVTAVSGSGPAYAFYLVEAMTEAGLYEGLSREQALTLSINTLAGAAALLIQSGQTPENLRKMVTSPGGTTQAAITSMEEDHVKQNLIKAVRMAAEKSRELGKQGNPHAKDNN